MEFLAEVDGKTEAAEVVSPTVAKVGASVDAAGAVDAVASAVAAAVAAAVAVASAAAVAAEAFAASAAAATFAVVVDRWSMGKSKLKGSDFVPDMKLWIARPEISC